MACYAFIRRYPDQSDGVTVHWIAYDLAPNSAGMRQRHVCNAGAGDNRKEALVETPVPADDL